jgi:hypothetical protein
MGTLNEIVDPSSAPHVLCDTNEWNVEHVDTNINIIDNHRYCPHHSQVAILVLL